MYFLLETAGTIDHGESALMQIRLQNAALPVGDEAQQDIVAGGERNEIMEAIRIPNVGFPQ